MKKKPIARTDTGILKHKLLESSSPSLSGKFLIFLKLFVLFCIFLKNHIMSEDLKGIDLDGPQPLSVLKFLKRIIVLF